MKRLQVFVLSLLVSLAAFGVCAPLAYAEGGATPIPVSGGDPQPTDDPGYTPGWIEVDGKYAYILDDGSRAIGWLTIDGQLYWFDADGWRADNGWYDIDGERYWFDADGHFYANGWFVIDGHHYNFDENGHLRHDCFIEYKNNLYYLTSDGTASKGWLKLDGATYYSGSDGALLRNKGKQIDGKWYYFNSDYKMRVNDYIYTGGYYYWFGSDGALAIGWFQVGGSWYYAGSDGRMYRNQYLSYEGNMYYFGNNCKAVKVTGTWVNYNGNRYYRFTNGTYAGGWTSINGNWYYFHPTNKFLFTSRRIKYDNKFYYVGSDGAAYWSRKAPDGSTINAHGERVSGPVDTKAQGYSSSTGYLILVSYDYHTVNIFTGKRNNWKLTQCFPCSMGKSSTPTPRGTYYTTGRTYSFGDSDHTCYYATGYIGMTYLFHSVLYYPGTYNVKDGRLGLNISNGCIRLYIEDAKWIYDTVPLNTTVVIY